MAGVNFSQLQPIQAPQAMGSVPMTPNQPSALGNVGQALSNLGQVMGQGQLRDMQLKKGEQDLMLGEKDASIKDLQIQKGTMEVEDAQAQRRTAAQLSEAAKGGWDNYIKTKMSIDPAGAMDDMKKKADYEKTTADTIGVGLDNVKKGWENFDNTAMHLGDLANATSSLMIKGPDGQPTPASPQQKAAFFNKGLEVAEAPRAVVDNLKKVFPEGYTDDNAAILMTSGGMASSRLAAAEERKNKSTPSPVKKMQMERDAETNPTNKAELNQAIQKDITPAKVPGALSPGQQIAVASTGEYLKQRATDKIANSRTISAMDLIEKTGDKALSGSFASLDLGLRKAISAITGVSVDDKTAATEVLDAAAKQYQIGLQVLMKGSTSEKDMELLQKASPQITNSALGKQMMANQLKYKAVMDNEKIDFENAWSSKHDGDMTGANDAWNKAIGSRNDFDVKTGMFKSMPSSKDWKPFLDENYSAPVTKAINGVTYEQRDGKWYTK